MIKKRPVGHIAHMGNCDSSNEIDWILSTILDNNTLVKYDASKLNYMVNQRHVSGLT